MTMNPDAPIALRPLYRLQFEEAQQAYVLLFPEGMIQLNEAAAEVIKRCDGTKSANQIIGELKVAFDGADLDADVLELLQVAHDRGWIHSVAG